jgi:hypothetical protein
MLALRVVRENRWWQDFQERRIARRVAARSARQAVLSSVA